MKELFLFVRPPRPVWPFNGPSTAFWPPLAFASLAAALRDRVADIDVRILDCLSPRYVGIGEEAVSAVEGLRLARAAKALEATVIAGGCTFGNIAREVLSTGAVDVVVRGEGEDTICEAVEALRGPRREDALSRVRGISYLRGGEPTDNDARPLIDDLDRLPMPAYDLLPMSRYGRGSRNHPDLATIEHGRGCANSCGYCVLWRQMAREGRSGPEACFRTKSPERVMEEIRVLRARYGRKYLAWVDPCFNADAGFLEGLARLMRKEQIRIGQSAWVRADCLARDERSGLLGEIVETGLNEVFIGIERSDEEGLTALGRSGGNAGLDILPVISRKYPSLYLVGSFIYGLPGDSKATVRAMRDATIDLNIDMAFYIPLTRLPGTPSWDPAIWDSDAKGLRGMNFLTTGDHDAEVERITRELALSFLTDWRPKRIGYVARTLFARDARKRRMSQRLFLRGGIFALRQAFMSSKYGNGAAMPLPKWYNK